jgi:hypothetical protein
MFARIVMYVGIADFLSFCAVSLVFGDASNGYTRGGQYFLGNQGVYKEVSQFVWELSRLHALSVFVTFPLAIVAESTSERTSVIRRPSGPREEAEAAARVHIVRSSGARLAAARLNGSRLPVSVYPAGIIVSTYLGGDPSAILSSEVLSLGVSRSFGRLTRLLVIEHASRGVASPLYVAQAPQSDRARAIERITGKSLPPQPRRRRDGT